MKWPLARERAHRSTASQLREAHNDKSTLLQEMWTRISDRRSIRVVIRRNDLLTRSKRTRYTRVIAALVADADTRSGLRQLVSRTHVAVTKTLCRLNCLVVARDSRDLPTARPKQRGLTGVTLPYLVSSPRCLCHQRDSAVSDRLGALALVVQSAAPCPT